jgi:hypothetical protein
LIASPPPAASFAALPAGWHSFASAGETATSWAYVPGRGFGGWADQMPRGGIAVSVTFTSSRSRLESLRLVLPRTPAVMLEGTTDTPEYRIAGRTHGQDVIILVIILVDIRNPHPTAAQLGAAQRVVASIRFD